MDATTSLERQKKGNLYVYKFSPITNTTTTTTGRTPDNHHQKLSSSKTKRIIPSSILWRFRKSKSNRPKLNQPEDTNNVDKDKGGLGKGNEDVRVERENEKAEVEKERKSYSSVEGILMRLASSNGRKSVSEEVGNNNNNNNKGNKDEFPFIPLKEGNDNNKMKMQEGRNSVSHVENNIAYVGNKVVGGDGEKQRNKSLGVKLENNMASSIALLQVKVLVTDMPGFMQIHAFQCARNTFDSLEIFSAKHLASNLKKEFDKVYGPAWHCIVGSSFGSFVTHATGCFLYFSMEKLCILLFRTKVRRTLQ